MLKNKAKTLEFTKNGWTNLVILQTADLTTTAINGGTITLDALVAGDLVQDAFIEIPTLITGPTGAPTVQVKLGSVAITPTVAIESANYAVTDNTVVGSSTATTATNLTATFAAGGGNGAAAATGEIWIWYRKSTQADRNSFQVE